MQSQTVPRGAPVGCWPKAFGTLATAVSAAALMRKLRRENVLSNPPSFAFFVDSISPPMQAHRAWLNADGLRMYTRMRSAGMGSRTAQHRPGLSQLIDLGFYAQSCFNFKILCFAWTGAAIFWFLSV